MGSTILTILVIVLIIAIILLAVLYFYGRRLQDRNLEAERTLESFTQTMPMLVIDKKRMRLKDAPFPKEVFEKTPFYAKWMKICVVQVKLGPRVVNLICDKNVYDQIPLKTTIQGTISGLYLKEIKKGAVPTQKMIEKRRKEKAKAEKKAKKNQNK